MHSWAIWRCKETRRLFGRGSTRTSWWQEEKNGDEVHVCCCYSSLGSRYARDECWEFVWGGLPKSYWSHVSWEPAINHDKLNDGLFWDAAMSSDFRLSIVYSSLTKRFVEVVEVNDEMKSKDESNFGRLAWKIFNINFNAVPPARVRLSVVSLKTVSLLLGRSLESTTHEPPSFGLIKVSSLDQ